MTISAEIVEGVVIDTMKAALADVHGRASAQTNAKEAEQALVSAQGDFDADLVPMMAGVAGVAVRPRSWEGPPRGPGE